MLLLALNLATTLVLVSTGTHTYLTDIADFINQQGSYPLQAKAKKTKFGGFGYNPGVVQAVIHTEAIQTVGGRSEK